MAEVHADEVCWAPTPAPRLESIDLLTLTGNDLLSHARDLQLQLTAIYLLAHEAVARVAQLTAHLDRQTEIVIRLHELLRAQRRLP